MSTRLCCKLVRCLLSLLALGVVSGAPLRKTHAQAYLGEPPAYTELINRAFVEYEAKNFPESRALFQKAHAVYPNARVLRSLGMVEFELRNYDDSAGWLEQALASSVHPLSSELRADTLALLSRARGFVGRLLLTIEPATTSVIVDGVPQSIVPDGVISLEVGDHSLDFRADGFVTERRRLKIQGGDEHAWRVALVSARTTPPALAADSLEPTFAVEPEKPRERTVFVVPRFTLVLPGGGSYRRQCTGSACSTTDASTSELSYDRNAAPMLGADLMFAPAPALRLGVGLHAQLNRTTWAFEDDMGKSEFGRAFWLPAFAEYRVPLTGSLSLPLRIMTGLAFEQAGSDLKRVGKSADEVCQRAENQGSDCSVAGPPGVGVVLGVAPGFAYRLEPITLRADLTLGYQWTRLVKLERVDEGSSTTQKQTDGTFIAALSVGVEL